MLTLDTKLEALGRIGAATAKKLKKLELATAQDLLLYFPFRYDDFSRVTPIKDLKPGESANVVGRLELIQNKRSFRRRMNITEALVTDGDSSVKVIWFNQPYITKNLKEGDLISIAGKVDEDFSGPYFSAPSYERLTDSAAVHTQGLVPNYHLTEGLTQKQLRFFLKQIIGLSGSLPDWLPEDTRKKHKLLPYAEAVKNIHFPKTLDDSEVARRRIAFNELILLQLQSQLVRRELAEAQASPVPFQEEATKKFVARLNFKLTNDQRKAAWAILRDLEQPHPMSRLLEGDVGSGKTVVAALALLNVALAGKQAALLAPTEILAAQHFQTLSKLFEETGIKIGLVTRSSKQIFNFQFFPPKRDPAEAVAIFNKTAKKNNKLSAEFIIQNSDIIIGTHALIQDKIKFKNLALAVIDEQHRFGVAQRQALLEKAGSGLTPHLLSLTATPIPRSLALGIYGDLDISVIKESPTGRKKILTKIVPEDKRAVAYRFIREQIVAGRQVFVICPLIDFSDKLGVKSVKQEYERLDKQVFPDLKIGILHGKMKAAEKEKVMREFLENKIKILVSTSVVEVGVDVPNASVMMIEGAERFGLAQLHQFRGRVGRSIHQSYCFLFSESESEQSLRRLETLVNHFDGFELAKMDLKFRGAGRLFGTEQSGFPELKIATLFDYELMREAREAALALIDEDAELKKWPELKALVRPLLEKVHLE
jgi:ATP-dependent DNA helicase RecG